MLAPLAVRAGGVPDQSYPAALVGQVISPQLGAAPHNQPHVVRGHLFLAGNAEHAIWDIGDPFAPVKVGELTSPHRFGEAESHMLSFALYPDGTLYAVTISGRGVDIWNLDDLAAPRLVRAVELEGIDYGDYTAAVWGVFWQGDIIYVGGTDTGLHLVDARVPADAHPVARIPTSALGGVRVGPVFPIGNLLVIGEPKNGFAVATADIGDPLAPSLLDVHAGDTPSYIAWFFGRHAYQVTPFRTLDVTSDPTDIRLLGSSRTPRSEYVSFADDLLFLGGSHASEPGLFKYDIRDPDALRLLRHIPARPLDGIDDQFSVPVGNLVVMSDDEARHGSALAVHAAARDTTPPRVEYLNPPDGATGQPLTTRIGLSFSDQIELDSVGPDSLIVRPVGGAPLAGVHGIANTVVSFWPERPLAPDTTYEIVVPAGGVRDLVGNRITVEVRALFSTGPAVTAPRCAIAPLAPVAVGEAAVLAAEPSGVAARYRWWLGDRPIGGGQVVDRVFHRAGRHVVTLAVAADGVTRRCSAVQIVHRPAATPAPASSSTVAVDRARGLVWVVNPDADTVTAVDPVGLVAVAEIPVGSAPRTLAIAPDGLVWVAEEASDSIGLVDPERAERVAAIALPYGSMPHGIAFAPDGRRAYATLPGTGQLAEIDPAGRCLVRLAAAGADRPAIRGVSVTPDSATLAVTRFLSPADRGELILFDAARLERTRVVALAPDPGPDTDQSGRGVPNLLGAAALAPDGRRLLVPAVKDDLARGLARDGLPLGPDNTVRAMAAAIDLETGAEIGRIDLDDRDSPSAIAWSELGDLVFIASQGSNQVDVYDGETLRLVGGVGTELAPQGLAVAGDRLYVQGFTSRALAVHDIGGLVSGRDSAAAPLATVTTVAAEPLAPDVLLGEQIFHNADDRRMSRDGYLSCASCHPGGSSDGRVWDFTDRGEGLRNTIALEGRRGTGHGPLHWTGNFDEVQDFENDIRAHFGGGGFMADADFDAHGDPLGEPKAGLSAALDALAAYVGSLDRYPKSPYRDQDGTFSRRAERGRAVFERLACAACHAGPDMTDSGGPLHDVGSLTAASGDRLGQPLTGLDTPTLRGVFATAPYLHDGSAARLADALADPRHTGGPIEPEDVRLLVAYLLELEGPERDDAAPSGEPVAWCPAPPAGGDPVGCGCGAAGAGSPLAPFLALALLALVGRRARRRYGWTGSACGDRLDG